MPKSDAFMAGYREAERQMYVVEDDPNAWYSNPFAEGTDEHAGFEEGFYDFTQK